ncbi:MAG: hypothetical protein QW261_10645 [Candidatus Jordarchaeaceae archaeon]
MVNLLIHAIYILSSEGKPLYIKENSKKDINIKELTNFVSALSDFSSVFTEKKSDNGFSSFVIGENGFIFHRDTNFTMIAVIDPQQDSSDISKFKKIYKKFQEKYDTLYKDGKNNKKELEYLESEIQKILEGNNLDRIINFKAIEDLLWSNMKN